MYLFLLLIFPLSLIYAVFSNDQKGKLLTVLFAAGLAAVISAFNFFFMYFDAYSGRNFLWYFLSVFADDFILPALCYVFYFFFSKRERASKCSSLLLFLLSFYAVYIPYLVLRGFPPFSYFELFIKPLLYLALSTSVSLEITAALNQSSKSRLPRFLFYIITIFSPAFIEAAWRFMLPFGTWTILAFVYLVYSVWRVLRNKKQVADLFNSVVSAVFAKFSL